MGQVQSQIHPYFIRVREGRATALNQIVVGFNDRHQGKAEKKGGGGFLQRVKQKFHGSMLLL